MTTTDKKHFLQDRFGKTVKVEQIKKPEPAIPESQTSIHLHKRRTFLMRKMYDKDEIEGQDYDVE